MARKVCPLPAPACSPNAPGLGVQGARPHDCTAHSRVKEGGVGSDCSLQPAHKTQTRGTAGSLRSREGTRTPSHPASRPLVPFHSAHRGALGRQRDRNCDTTAPIQQTPTAEVPTRAARKETRQNQMFSQPCCTHLVLTCLFIYLFKSF